MKKYFFFFVLLSFVSCTNSEKKSSLQEGVNNDSTGKGSQNAGSEFLTKHPILSLPGKSPVEIGCILQNEFEYRDVKFNCDNKNYINNGDPCKNTVEYYEGVEMPVEVAKRIHSNIKEMKMSFEHGNLREVLITFEDSMLINKIREEFALPSNREKFPENVIDIGYGENIFSKEKPINPDFTRWLLITSFDHIGAGDVDCE